MCGIVATIYFFKGVGGGERGGGGRGDERGGGGGGVGGGGGSSPSSDQNPPRNAGNGLNRANIPSHKNKKKMSKPKTYLNLPIFFWSFLFKQRITPFDQKSPFYTGSE